MDAPAALDQLFAAPRAEFTPLRDRLVKQARAGHEDELVRRLRALRKPTVAAWLVNQVARQHPDDVARLAELGARLRESHRTLDGERLRELSHQRHELSETLTGHARRIAADTGGAVGNAVADQLAATWSAAAAGADAAEQVRAGMLGATPTGGFDDWLLGTPPAGGSTPAKPREKTTAKAPAKARARPRDEVAAKRRERAERQRQDDREQRELDRRRRAADAEVRTAEQALAEAEQGRADAERAATDAAETVTGLRAELDELRRRLDEAVEAERAARAHRTSARNTAITAQRAVAAAERRLTQLD